MPFDVMQCAETDIVTVRLEGGVDGEEVLGALDALDALVESGARVPAFWDGRGITMLAISPTQMARLVGRMLEVGRRIGPGRTAIMTRRNLDGLMARVLELHLGRSPRVWKMFNREDAAMAWLLETREISEIRQAAGRTGR
jgi:hypothetical protein